MFTAFTNMFFPCEKRLKSLREAHRDAMERNIKAKDDFMGNCRIAPMMERIRVSQIPSPRYRIKLVK
jgi:hypothetical protein